MDKVVSVEWLHKNLDNTNLILLDASINSSVNKHYKDTSQTISKARWFDIKNVFSDTSKPFPNTLPSKAQFEVSCQLLGINNDSQIVVFDRFGIYSSPRVWWLFHIMGHTNIAVLNGGLPEWIKKGYSTTNSFDTNFTKGNFTAQYQKELVVDFKAIDDNTKTQQFLVVDARSKERFNGTGNEPRKHLKSGHIPNSVNIPYESVLDGNVFKNKEALSALFKEKCDTNELVFSCGSGVTACIVMLACNIAFKESQKVYDGSWTEWAELKNLKV